MINLIKNYIYILNILILISFIVFSISFYFETKINFLSDFLILISFSTLVIKLIYWYLIRKEIKTIKNLDQSSLFLLRLAFCIFTYIAPAYYIIQKPNLVMSHNIIFVTLIIISILMFIGLIIGKYLFLLESDKSFESLIRSNKHL